MDVPRAIRPASEMVPHRGAMLLLDAILAFDGENVDTTGVVRADNPFLFEDGVLDPLAAIELVAQGAAALEGLRREMGGIPVGGGFLVGVKDFAFTGTARVGDELSVFVHRGPEFEALKLADGVVRVGGREIARGELKLFVSDTMKPPELGAAAVADLPEVAAPSMFPVFPGWGARGEGGAEYRLGGGFPPFHGHFPGFALVPAVATTILAIEPARLGADGQRAMVRRIVTAKYQRAVGPGASLAVAVTRGDGARWSSRVSMAEGPVATMSYELDHV